MKKLLIVCAAAIPLAACTENHNDAVNLAGGFSSDALYAPWDSLSNDTHFECRCDRDSFYFSYSVNDSTLVLVDPFLSEKDVDPEDRVEFFFSADSTLSLYHCAEIDPLGRVMDYEISFYRNFDFSWNYSALRAEGSLTENGYEVKGALALKELNALGIPVDGKPFWFGIFQADYRPDGSVIWYSYIPTSDTEPDFHKPGVLFKACISLK